MITIVSGLPRSGTSLMMQMLVAGGMLPLTDEERPPMTIILVGISSGSASSNCRRIRTASPKRKARWLR